MSDDLKLRADVAVEIFGWERQHPDNPHWYVKKDCPLTLDGCLPSYETSLDASREVLREMERRGLCFSIEFHRHLADIILGKGKWQFDMCGEHWFKMIRATPEQICRAALAAVRQSAESPTIRRE